MQVGEKVMDNLQRILCLVGSCVFRFFRDVVFYILSLTRWTYKMEVAEEETDHNYSEVVLVQSCSSSSQIAPCKLMLIEDGDFEDNVVILQEEEKSQVLDMNEYISSMNSSQGDVSLSQSSSSTVFSSNKSVNEQVIDEEEISDVFYNKYSERMKWFDMLNYDRTCGISSTVNKQLGFGSNNEDFTSPYISWNKQTKKRLLRSIESDFELVYVAQSCLSWEALHYQYTKVKTTQTGVFYGNVVGELQNFQVLLERFMEDERCSDGRRIWNYVTRRLDLNSLLQVPYISGYSEEEKEEGIEIKQVLTAIESCIQAFGEYVTADNKKPWWKLMTSSLWSHPPVQNPRDLELLNYLTKRLQKNEVWLRDLQGKQRCFLRRVIKDMEESQRNEILFTMIDMKLVSRVLRMTTVSSSQLKWCKEMLDNVKFQDEKVFRIPTCPLFPP